MEIAPSSRDLLTNPAYRVPADGAGAPPGTVRWLRQHVARFSDGGAHAERRRRTEQLLDRLVPDRLRAAAEYRTGLVIDAANGRPFDPTALARRVPVLVLAEALGLADPAAAACQVPDMSGSYQPGTPITAGADAAVVSLVEMFEGSETSGGDEIGVAAGISLLVQSHDATATLIGRALAADGTDAAARVATVLRHDPPVLRTRRVDPSGRMVPVDLTTAGPDGGPEPFGAGPHRCPGARQAVAVAVGAVEVLLRRCTPGAGGLDPAAWTETKPPRGAHPA